MCNTGVLYYLVGLVTISFYLNFPRININEYSPTLRRILWLKQIVLDLVLFLWLSVILFAKRIHPFAIIIEKKCNLKFLLSLYEGLEERVYAMYVPVHIIKRQSTMVIIKFRYPITYLRFTIIFNIIYTHSNKVK